MSHESKTVDGGASITSQQVNDTGHARKELDGIPLMEVFSLKYLGYDEVPPENQLGSICIEYDNTYFHLYLENKVDIYKPSIKYGDQLFVMDGGPICSFTKLEVQFDLFCGAYNGYIEVKSEPFDHQDWLTEPRIKSVDGYGDISITLGYFSNATVANLEIELLNIPDATTANVYGAVIATNSKFDYPSCTSILFLENSANTIEVGHDGVIPLSKSRLGVPLDSTLYVDISLHCDGDHFKGTAEFNPLKEGESADPKMIGSRIRVKVTWNCNEDINPTDDFDSSSEYDSDENAEKEI